MATTTVPTTIRPKAIEMAKGLGLERELEFRIGRGAVTVVIRFADADDGDPASEAAFVA